MRVAVPGWDELADNLRAAGTNVVEGDAEVLVKGVPDDADLDERPSLHTVVIPWAGVPKSTKEKVAARPHLKLHNLHHNAGPTAETAFALMLAAAKRVVPFDRELRANDWTGRYAQSNTLLIEGSRALLLGYGAIGTRLEAFCRGMGMEIDTVRRADDPDPLLSNADVVFVAVPWTPETEGMLDARRLALLKDGAVVVNVARGPVIDEDAFFAELKSNRIRAGIDVWYTYPKDKDERTVPSKHPFGELDNVVLSPHRAGHCEGIESLRARDLVTLLTSDPMPNRVDLDAGY